MRVALTSPLQPTDHFLLSVLSVLSSFNELPLLNISSSVVFSRRLTLTNPAFPYRTTPHPCHEPYPTIILLKTFPAHSSPACLCHLADLPTTQMSIRTVWKGNLSLRSVQGINRWKQCCLFGTFRLQASARPLQKITAARRDSASSAASVDTGDPGSGAAQWRWSLFTCCAGMPGERRFNDTQPPVTV